MKRSIFGETLKKTFLAIPAAALMLGASQSANGQSQFGINFFGSGYQYGNTNVTATAFGIDPTNWFTTPYAGTGIGYNGKSGSVVVAIPSGGTFNLTWSSANTWDSDFGDNGSGAPTPGEPEVAWGFLDDTSPGYTATISGLRSFAGSYTIQTVAADLNATGFENVSLITNNVTAEMLNYTNDPSQLVTSGSSEYATSTLSSTYYTVNGNDSITLKGVVRSGSVRSTLAGIILTYTPGNNAPLVQTQPQSVTNGLFLHGSFSLSSSASGTPALGYQWYNNSAAIAGATNLNYTNSNAALSDSGNYTIVITNNYGSATSAVAVVTVQNIVFPVITQAPYSQSPYAGYPVTFTVAATGGQLAYQWTSNTVALTGATNTSYAIAGVTSNNVAVYKVIVSNPAGSTSASASLSIQIPAPGSYEAAMAQTKPAIWFRYGETGIVAQDLAQNSGSLASAGTGSYITVQHPVPGALAVGMDTAAAFNGSSSVVKVPYNSQLNTSVFTAEAWVNPATNGANLCVFSCGDFASPRAGWLIYQQTTGWDLRTYNQNTTTLSMEITSTTAPVVGSWTHLAITYDGTILTLYVNGVSVGTKTNTGGLYIPGTAGPLAVGARADGSFYWPGSAGEVAYYSTALTAGQIASHYQNGISSSPSQSYSSLIASANPVEYLKLNEPAFTLTGLKNSGFAGPGWNGTAVDAGGIPNQPQIALGQAGPQSPIYPGFESNNLALTLTNGYASAPTFLLSNTMSVACWIYTPNASGNTAGDLSFIAWLGDSGGSGFFMNNNNELRYQWGSANAASYGFASGLIVPAQTWTFVALVVQTNQATFYMGSGTNLQSATYTATQNQLNSVSPINFGGGQPGNATRTFIGQLDESAIYNRSLTSDEINTLFLVGSGAPFQVGITPGGIIEDTKPVGTPDNGSAYAATWLASSADFNSVTRNGVEQFSATNNSQITIPYDNKLNSPTGTICFWVNYNYPLSGGLPGAGSEAAIIFDNRDTSANQNGTVIGINGTTSGGNIEFQASVGSGERFSGNTYVANGSWHHVAITYDQSSNGVVAIYVDGNLDTAVNNTNAWSWPTNLPIELGRSRSTYWKIYNGQLDDFRMYNQVLSQSDIQTIVAGESSGLVDSSELVLRYNFDNVGLGETVTWPFGTLFSSPVLGPNAVWTPVTNAVAPGYPVLPVAPAQFFRASP